MRIVCWQTFLMKHPTVFQKFRKMSQNVSSAAVVIGVLKVKTKLHHPERENCVSDSQNPLKKFSRLFALIFISGHGRFPSQKYTILVIDNVIFAFYDHRFGDRKRCVWPAKTIFDLNQYVRDCRLPGHLVPTKGCDFFSNLRKYQRSLRF